jgi:hypothetical protein
MVGVAIQLLHTVGVAIQSLDIVAVAIQSLNIVGVAIQSLNIVGVAIQSLHNAIQSLNIVGVAIRSLNIMGVAIQSLQIKVERLKGKGGDALAVGTVASDAFRERLVKRAVEALERLGIQVLLVLKCNKIVCHMMPMIMRMMMIIIPSGQLGLWAPSSGVRDVLTSIACPLV